MVIASLVSILFFLAGAILLCIAIVFSIVAYMKHGRGGSTEFPTLLVALSISLLVLGIVSIWAGTVMPLSVQFSSV